MKARNKFAMMCLLCCGLVLGLTVACKGYSVQRPTVNPVQEVFSDNESPKQIDWSSIQFSGSTEWNRGMQLTGTIPRDCSARLYKESKFRGTLVARRFRLHEPGTPSGSKSFIANAAVLKLDHPINICFTGFPDPGYSRFVTRQEKESLIRVSALAPLFPDLLQLGAYNRKYIGHRVEITGRASLGEKSDIEAVQYNLVSIIVDRVCLLRHSKPVACSSNKRGL